MSPLDELENDPFFTNFDAVNSYGAYLPYARKLCRHCNVAPVAGEGKGLRRAMYCAECKPLAQKERWRRHTLKQKEKRSKGG